MMTVEFSIPWPPTANNLFANSERGGRHTAPKAKAFRKAVGENVLLQRVPRHQLSGRLRVTLMLQAPDRKAYDIDNRVKATLDALVANGVIADDSIIDELFVYRRQPQPPAGQARIIIEEISYEPA